MQALVTSGTRFLATPDGTLWAFREVDSYRYWVRYLDVYDEIRLLVRAKPVQEPSQERFLVSGTGVKPVLLPYFEGPWQFSRVWPRIRAITRGVIARVQSTHLRLPCPVGDEVWASMWSGRPYGVEILGDPYDVFSRGAVRHPARPFFRWLFPRRLRRQCAAACATCYVTEHALQLRYPPRPEAFTTHCSDVMLGDSDFVSAPRNFHEKGQESTFTIVSVATLAQLYKGPETLIEATALCVASGMDLRLVMVGEGKHRADLELRASALGLSERARFTGNLPTRACVRQELDRADLFVLPSRQEGLPRAMIEAMARGLPCVGSAVGGIPELLPSEDMVPKGDPASLARKIREVLSDPMRRKQMSARNLRKAREYNEAFLRVRRVEFLKYVSDRTEEWFRRPRNRMYAASESG